MHVSSLPSRGPIGDLGPAAFSWLEWLESAGCRLWQILPLGPLGPGYSPYAGTSAFAAEPALLSVEGLVADGLLDPVALPDHGESVDWEAVEGWKRPLLYSAARRLVETAKGDLEAYESKKPWVRDWARFETMRAAGGSWPDWEDAALRDRRPAALARWDAGAAEEISICIALQLLFDRQWAALRAEATRRGIAILGDLPLFVAPDGCDTWTRRSLFRLDVAGRPTVVAGAPPDDFSPEGQRWGSPAYEWAEHEREGFAWWGARVGRVLEHADEVRIDHFRGLDATWLIAADEPDARQGQWEPSPGATLFDALGPQPLFAEDLGHITPAVEALRARVGLPGMKVLQFAFGEGADHPYLPHNFGHPHWVVATATHDTDTTCGWYESAPEHARDRLRRYVGGDGSAVSWDLIRLAWASPAARALAPMQDVLSLGSEARMNTPGTETGNWGWRMEDVPWWAASRLHDLAESYGRLD